MYCEYFGLSRKPFRLAPDATFFYPSAEHQRALAFLEYGLDQADGFIVVTGAVGTGKSTLVQRMVSELDPKAVQVATVVTTRLKEDDLLVWVATRFGLEVEDEGKAATLHKLEKLLLQRASSGLRSLLVVDEAQNLAPDSVEELRMLTNFQHDGRPLLQVFLVGQEEFRATLMSPGFEQLRQRVIATYHLNPLDADETRTYIEHRLSLVDWKRDPEISADAFQAIHGYSDGVPRKINNLCDRLFLYAYLEELHSLDAIHVRTVAEEISAEFRFGMPDGAAKSPARQVPQPEQPDQPGHRPQGPSATEPPLETMAKIMFDKANVQQRLATLERGIDGLGQSLKPDIASLKEELYYVRMLLEELLSEIRERPPVRGVNQGKVPRSVNQ
jgi:general secretion pathway protein A